MNDIKIFPWVNKYTREQYIQELKKQGNGAVKVQTSHAMFVPKIAVNAFVGEGFVIKVLPNKMISSTIKKIQKRNGKIELFEM